MHGGNGSQPSSDVAHCDSVKAMFGTAPGSELWSGARTAVPWHGHRRRSPGAIVAGTGSVGSPRRGLCLLVPYSHCLCPTCSLMEIQDLPSGVSRPQQCYPMILGISCSRGSRTLSPSALSVPSYHLTSTAEPGSTAAFIENPLSAASTPETPSKQDKGGVVVDPYADAARPLASL